MNVYISISQYSEYRFRTLAHAFTEQTRKTVLIGWKCLLYVTFYVRYLSRYIVVLYKHMVKQMFHPDLGIISEIMFIAFCPETLRVYCRICKYL